MPTIRPVGNRVDINSDSEAASDGKMSLGCEAASDGETASSKRHDDEETPHELLKLKKLELKDGEPSLNGETASDDKTASKGETASDDETASDGETASDC